MGIIWPRLLKTDGPAKAKEPREAIKIVDEKKKKSLTVKSDKNKIELSCEFSVMTPPVWAFAPGRDKEIIAL